MTELLKIALIALAVLVLLGGLGLGGIALIFGVIIPLIGKSATGIMLVVLLFIIICVKVHFEIIEWRKING